jgi:hypothetical protein
MMLRRPSRESICRTVERGCSATCISSTIPAGEMRTRPGSSSSACSATGSTDCPWAGAIRESVAGWVDGGPCASISANALAVSPVSSTTAASCRP